MKSPIFIASAIFICLCASGCNSVKRNGIDLEIANAFSKVSGSLEQLALIESAGTNGGVTKAYDFDDMGLPATWMVEVTLVDDFYGPVESFVRIISMIAGLKEPDVLKEKGRPKFIAIAKGKRKVISFLADAGAQAGDHVEVSPLIQSNKVVVTYK